MTDKPIIFSASMIRALLDGRKAQTRRVLKPQPGENATHFRGGIGKHVWDWPGLGFGIDDDLKLPKVPYAPGDRLWVREAHAYVPYTAYLHSDGVEMTAHGGTCEAAIYRAGFDRSQGGIRWRPSIHMPRWASRLTLTVTDVRVQRLQDITGRDVIAEGVRCKGCHDVGTGDYSACRDGGCFAARNDFRDLWNSINGPDAWASNPWVVALTFDVHRRNIDSMGQA